METVLAQASTGKISGQPLGYTSVPSEPPSYAESQVQPPYSNGVQNENKEKITFSRLPQKTPIDITFENVTYTATSGLIRRERKEILHQINGRFPPGQLIAIMGPSGAGKSTLLDVLSGYRKTGLGGTVYTNGSPRDLNEFRRMSCYITQDDRLQPLLTVAENMSIAADLKLGMDIPQREKDEIIEEILNTLGLDKTAHTRAGRISGGQKKRLSIALELINNPLVLFLDEPTTGLDSSSCSQCVKLLRELARQGRTIVCTIHQPSASLFQLFDQVYVLAQGNCVYQGTTEKLVPFLESVNLPCPMYHNPADFVIELACGEYGFDKIDDMIIATDNGRRTDFFEKPEFLPSLRKLKETHQRTCNDDANRNASLQGTSQYNQLRILLRRGFIKAKRDETLTYLRFGVNIITGIMLGTLWWQAGSHGAKVLDNYKLLFAVLMHHMMSPMMLTILTFPSEMSVLTKEHFNRWYSLKMYYVSITLVDIPISVICCLIFTVMLYLMTGQPIETQRFMMFTAISILTVFVAQSFGLMIGAIFDVVNGTFMGPCLSVPMMMFAGFGVRLADLPPYLSWGSYVSYLRYGLEGYVGSIYGLNRETLWCPDDEYCHYKYPEKMLSESGIAADQFWNDIVALVIILFFMRIVAFVLLKWKLSAIR